MSYLFTSLFGSFGIIGTAFWVWMLYDCLQNERDRQTWLWILIFLNVIGAVLYFFTRWMPRASVPMPSFTKRWTCRNALWQAEAEAKNIGKAHQFIKLGNILYEIGDYDRATESYQQALAKEPENPQALWGAICVAIDRKQLDTAKMYLQTLVKVKPDFMYGDASLTYGRVLFSLGELAAANTHLEQHLKSWGHPEAYVMLSKIQQQQGNSQAARETLETMIVKIKSSAPFQYRKNQGFVRQGERMLKVMGR